jgi:hypothetical protein
MSRENELKSLFDDVLKGQIDEKFEFETKIIAFMTAGLTIPERLACQDENLWIINSEKGLKFWKIFTKNDEYVIATHRFKYDGRDYIYAVTNYGLLFRLEITQCFDRLSVGDFLHREGRLGGPHRQYVENWPPSFFEGFVHPKKPNVLEQYFYKLFLKSLATMIMKNWDEKSHIIFMLKIIDEIVSRHDSSIKSLQENNRLQQEHLKLKKELEEMNNVYFENKHKIENLDDENLKLKKKLEEMDDAYFSVEHLAQENKEMKEENLKLKKELEEMDDVYFDNKHKIFELSNKEKLHFLVIFLFLYYVLFRKIF